MSGQSWKQAVEDLAGPEPPLTLAYTFSGGEGANTVPSEDKKKRLSGVFFERRAHGAFDGTE